VATKLREAEVAHFSLEGRNPPGPRQALTSLVLNRLIPGGMSVLRRVRPVWKVPGRDLVVVTGFDAVQEVFSRQHDFEVPYEERVELIHFDGFLLALQDTDEYHKMHDGITQLFCPDDTGQVKSIIRDTTADILAGRGRDLDLIQDLVKPVVLAVVEQYYGVPVPEALAQPFFDGNLASSGFVFAGPRITAKQAAIARAAVAEVWPVIDAAMDAARRSPNRATVLGRYYACWAGQRPCASPSTQPGRTRTPSCWTGCWRRSGSTTSSRCSGAGRRTTPASARGLAGSPLSARARL